MQSLGFRLIDFASLNSRLESNKEEDKFRGRKTLRNTKGGSAGVSFSEPPFFESGLFVESFDLSSSPNSNDLPEEIESLLNLCRRTVNLRRPERARNEGSTGPKRLDDAERH